MLCEVKCAINSKYRLAFTPFPAPCMYVRGASPTLRRKAQNAPHTISVTYRTIACHLRVHVTIEYALPGEEILDKLDVVNSNVPEYRENDRGI